MNLREQLGNIDIYLLDQVLRGHLPLGGSVLDAGCGRGRNVEYFLREGYPVCGIDADPAAVETVRLRAEQLGRPADGDHFRVEAVEDLSFAEGTFDLVICNAVLHFARDFDHFGAMADALHRVTAPGGIVFCRLASTIGIEPFLDADATVPGWHRLPDGSDRFLVDLETLLSVSDRLEVDLVDPIKTVNVQNLRCMTNWVWRRR